MHDAIMDITGLTTRRELEFLQRCCRGLPGHRSHALEVGTFNGRSTAALCEILGDDRVISVDNYKMQHHGENTCEIARRNLARLRYCPILLENVSPLSPLTIETLAPQGLALVFLDGHHHPDTVVAELDTYGPLLLSGGAMLLHDFGRQEYPGYTEAIDAWFHTHAQDWDALGLAESLIAFRKL